MSITFCLTKHAQEQITTRNISLSWIERTLLNPQKIETDKLDPDLVHALATIPEFDDRVLRVVYNPKEKPLKVITVYFDRKMRGKI